MHSPDDSPADSAAPIRKPKGVVAVERGLAILDAFLGMTESRGLSELARATQLPKATVLRSLISLERMGYVLRLSGGRYQLGARLLHLGDTYRANFRLEDHVLPVIQQLALATGESAAFQIRDQDRRLTLFRVESQQPVRHVPAVRAALPLDGAAASHVLRQPDGPDAAQRGPRLVFHTAAMVNPQTASLATAVYGGGGGLRGALVISGPIERLRVADLEALARQITAAADRLGAALGAPPRLENGPPELVRP